MKDTYTISVPVITTAHLNEEDVRRLEGESEDKPIADYGSGLFMYVGEFDREYYEGYSEAFYNLMEYLSGYEWVRFDADCGDEIEGLPVLEW